MLFIKTDSIVFSAVLGASLLLAGCDSSGVSVSEVQPDSAVPSDDDSSPIGSPVDDATGLEVATVDDTISTSPIDDDPVDVEPDATPGATPDATDTTPLEPVQDDTIFDNQSGDDTSSELPIEDGTLGEGPTDEESTAGEETTGDESTTDGGPTGEGSTAGEGTTDGGNTTDGGPTDVESTTGQGTTDDGNTSGEGTTDDGNNPAVVTLGDSLLNNGTFEDELSGWEQAEPAFESGDAFEGEGAVKLENFGSVTQSIVIQPNTRYIISAYIEGTASIGAVVGGETFLATGNNESYTLVSVEFDSLEAVNADIFARADVNTSRVDNFAVSSVSTETNVIAGTGTGTGTNTETGTETEGGAGENIATNSGFEDGLDGWEQVEPAAESGETFEGVGSAKVEDAGAISQTLTVDPASSYRVSAWVEGVGTIGVEVQGDRRTVSGMGGDFEFVSFTFDTGTADSVTLFAETFNGTGIARIDNFELRRITRDDLTQMSDPVDIQDLPAVPEAAINIVFNGTFENELSGWSQAEPAQSSGVTFEGSGSTKLSESGSISQRVFLVPQSSYLLTARLQGNPTLSITVGDQTSSVTGTGIIGGEYTLAALEFNSGAADIAQILVQATPSANDARVDNIELYKISVDAGGPEPIDPNTVFDFSIWEVEGEVPVSRAGNLVFDALEQCVITPNANGCRHEQKVQESERFALTDQYERFFASIVATLSPSSETIVAQHHPEETGTLAALYLSDRADAYPGVLNGIASDGIFDLYATVRQPGTLEEGVIIFGTVTSGEAFDYEVINDHGVLTMTALGNTFTVTPADSSSSYFKFGNYLQARDPVTGERLDLPKPHNDDARDNFLAYYSGLNITESIVTFSGVEYERILDEGIGQQ